MSQTVQKQGHIGAIARGGLRQVGIPSTGEALDQVSGGYRSDKPND